MSDIAAVITAISGLVVALGGAVAAIITAIRSSPRERRDAAREAGQRLLKAAKDGELTPEEIAEALKSFERKDDDQ